MTCAWVTLENVTVGRERPRIRDVSWRIGGGEWWAVVGPNGAGKSTLVGVLRGVAPRSAGTVRYDLPEPTGASGSDPWQRIVQVSFDAQAGILRGADGYAQSRWHSGHDAAVARGWDVLGSPELEGQAQHVVASLGLTEVLDRRVTELSNGERRKLLLARAAAKEPAILALDNPFSGLDTASRDALSADLHALHASGTTIVVTTCRPEEIDSGVTHVLLMEGGSVVAAGRRADVLEDRRAGEAVGAPARAPESPQAPRAPPVEPPILGGPRAGAPPVVELRDVSVRYGDVQLLEDVSWTVRRGERWVLLGPNGAGKSTLLSLILTDNPQAYANDVSLFGCRRGTGDSIWDIRRRMGCVSPELHLYHGHGDTAVEVVGSGLRDSLGLVRPLSPREAEAARECLAELGLEHLEGRRFGNLSEGEQQMVLVGRALVKRPELLVLDEPCQGLDASNRERFLALLADRLDEADRTLIYTTHDPEELRGVATHQIVLDRGRVAVEEPCGVDDRG